jgi:hypothetical protein
MTLQEFGLIGCFASEVEIVQPLKCKSVSVCTLGWEVVITNRSNALDRSNNMLAIQAAEFSGGNSPIQHRVEWGRPRFVAAEEFVGAAKFEQGLSSTPHLPSKADSSGK